MSPGFRGVGAVLVGKTARAVSRVTGRGGGSSLPGAVARRVSPTVLRDLVVEADVPVIAVTGSNGKTTTSRFITEILRGEGVTVSQNRDGANLLQGVTSLAVQTSGWNGRIPEGTVLVTEVDEGALRLVAPETSPRVLVVTNLFRDQLDRFGEIDAISDVIGVRRQATPGRVRTVANADDPLTSELEPTASTGASPLASSGPAYGRITSAADSIRCPRCRGDLEYSQVYLSHLGRDHCSRCEFTRPKVDVGVVELRH